MLCADPVFRLAAERRAVEGRRDAEGNDYLRFVPFHQHVQGADGLGSRRGRVSDVVAKDLRSAAPLERISTGVPELDEMLAGGLLPHRPYLLVGPPGSGKTTLALQFLIEGIRRGEEALYVTLEEPPNELRQNHQAMGPELEHIYVFDAVPDVMRYERVPFKDISSVREAIRFGQVPFTIRQTPEFESVEVTMTSLQPTLRQEVRRRHYKRLVIDSLTALQFFCMPGVDETQGAQTFLRFLSDLGTTTLLTLEVPGAEEESEEHLLARGELRLFRWEAEGKSQYAVGVEKFRGSSHDIHLHPYRISPRGLDINLSVTIPSGGVALPAQAETAEVLGVPPEEVAYEIRRSVLNLDQDIRDLIEVGVDVKPMHDGVRFVLTALAAHQYEEALLRLRETRSLADRMIQTYHFSDVAQRPKPPMVVPVPGTSPPPSPTLSPTATPSPSIAPTGSVSVEMPKSAAVSPLIPPPAAPEVPLVPAGPPVPTAVPAPPLPPPPPPPSEEIPGPILPTAIPPPSPFPPPPPPPPTGVGEALPTEGSQPLGPPTGPPHTTTTPPSPPPPVEATPPAPPPAPPRLVHRFFRRAPKPAAPPPHPLPAPSRAPGPNRQSVAPVGPASPTSIPSPTPAVPDLPAPPTTSTPSVTEPATVESPSAARPPSTVELSVPPVPPGAAAEIPFPGSAAVASASSIPERSATSPASAMTGLAGSATAPDIVPPLAGETAPRNVVEALPLPSLPPRPPKTRRRAVPPVARKRRLRPGDSVVDARPPAPDANVVVTPPPEPAPPVILPSNAPHRAPKRKRKAPVVTGADPGRMLSEAPTAEPVAAPSATPSPGASAPVAESRPEN
jgi:KaiC/GvpD/RAD55 family RecA-like ATPase